MKGRSEGIGEMNNIESNCGLILAQSTQRFQFRLPVFADWNIIIKRKAR
jgi:hypothetical protein